MYVINVKYLTKKAIKATLGNKFYIPLDFGIFKQPVYAFGLKDTLKVKLVFNSDENIILATGDKDAKYIGDW